MRKRIFVAHPPIDKKETWELLQEEAAHAEYRLFLDGLQAYQEVLDDPPNLLILDAFLPSLPGLAIVWLLKLHDDYRHIPIILVCPRVDDTLEKMARQGGADAVFSKPVPRHEYMDTVRRFTTR